MLTDLRYAVRSLTHAPGFALVIVLTLALGIGANTAIFSLMDQVLLRLLPVANPESLVQLDNPGAFSGRTMNSRSFSYPMYQDLRDQNDVFTGLIARMPAAVTLAHTGAPERAVVELVSGNTFDVLGIQAAVGRTLTPDDDRVPGAHPVVMLGHAFWMQRFNANPSVVGEVVRVNGTPMTIVGVAPRGFSGAVALAAPALFVPIMMKAQVTPTRNDLDNRRSRYLQVIGRLKTGTVDDRGSHGSRRDL